MLPELKIAQLRHFVWVAELKVFMSQQKRRTARNRPFPYLSETSRRNSVKACSRSAMPKPLKPN